MAKVLNDNQDAIHKRAFVLKELVVTEETYVEDLALVVNGYMAEMRSAESEIVIPEALKGVRERMIFGNIEAIYEWHRDYFLTQLKQCVLSPGQLGPFIKKSERKLHMYVVYCQNKPVSEHIVSENINYFEEIRMKFNHNLGIYDLLIKPIQRMTKYSLLLKDIIKYTERAGLIDELSSLQDALYVMTVVPKSANDMMDVGRIQKFEGSITQQGKLLLHGRLMCVESLARNSNSQQKFKELQIFLFEKSIIFSEVFGKKTQFTNPSYVYKNHIQVNKMTVEDVTDSSGNKFLVKSIDPNRQGLYYICATPTPILHFDWFNALNNILQSQNDFLKAIQNPIDHQKKLNQDV